MSLTESRAQSWFNKKWLQLTLRRYAELTTSHQRGQQCFRDELPTLRLA
jgi:hypothetical protein